MRTAVCLEAAVPHLTFVVLLLTLAAKALAGPPYITDDPVPVEYRHWEIYLASLFSEQPQAWTGTGPHLEVNYGAVPNVQLHLIAPLVFYIPGEGPSSYGYGDTELGIKIRFIHEGGWRPQIGTFPLLEGSKRIAQQEPWQRASADFPTDLAPKERGRMDCIRRRRLLDQSRFV